MDKGRLLFVCGVMAALVGGLFLWKYTMPPAPPIAYRPAPPAEREVSYLRYVYNGPLPILENAAVVASIKGLTVRVTGTLPMDWLEDKAKQEKDWRGQLPYYALVDQQIGKAPAVTVVYPMAAVTKPLSIAVRSQFPVVGHDDGGSFNLFEVTPWFSATYKTNHGLPIIHYAIPSSLGMAFHTPLGEKNEFAPLQRGYLAHGHLNMLPEHVVEMAHLIGVDMQKVYRQPSEGENWPRSNAKIRIMNLAEGYDLFNKQPLDVKYPVTQTPDEWVQRGVPKVERARIAEPNHVLVVPTWIAEDYPYFVCPVKEDPQRLAAQRVAPDYCEKNYHNKNAVNNSIKNDPDSKEMSCVLGAKPSDECFARFEE